MAILKGCGSRLKTKLINGEVKSMDNYNDAK